MFASVMGKSVRFFSTHSVKPVEHVVVIGSGLMGGGIAQVTAAAGINVTMVDYTDEILSKAKSAMGYRCFRSLNKQFPNDPEKVKTLVHETLQRVTLQTDKKEAVSNADLVIEAIVEDINEKQNLFRKLDGLADKRTIFVSNTSSLSITDMARVTQRPERFVGMHFFSPVPVMPLVELIRIDDTDQQVFDSVVQFARKIGKKTVECKDTPGFVVNRLLIPYLLEAIRLFERGDADAKDIDTAMKLGAGYKIGPLELLDFIGLDIVNQIIHGWNQKMPDNPMFSTSKVIDKMVEQGHLGRKSGKGFYDYSKTTVESNEEKQQVTR